VQNITYNAKTIGLPGLIAAIIGHSGSAKQFMSAQSGLKKQIAHTQNHSLLNESPEAENH